MLGPTLTTDQPCVASFRISLALLGLLVAATPLMAQEAGAARSPGLLSLQGGLMFWTLVVFVLVFVVLSKFAFGPITKAVERPRAGAARRDRSRQEGS